MNGKVNITDDQDLQKTSRIVLLQVSLKMVKLQNVNNSRNLVGKILFYYNAAFIIISVQQLNRESC